MGRLAMRVIRAVVITVGAVFTLLAGSTATAILLLDDDDYRQISVYLAQRLTGWTVAIDGPFSLNVSLQPSLAVSDVRVENPSWATQPYLAQVGHLEIQLALRPLLSGTLSVPRFVLEDAEFHLESGTNGERNWTSGTLQAEKRDSGFWMPLFGDVKLHNVTGYYRDGITGRDTSIDLATLSVDQTDGLNHLKGEGLWDSRKISTKGNFGTLTEALNPTKPFPLDLVLSLPDLELALRGTIAEPKEGRGLDLHLTAHSDDVSKLQKALGSDLMLNGQLEGSVEIKGDVTAPELADLSLTLADDKVQGATATKIGVTGRVKTIRPGGEMIADGIDLKVRATAPSAVMSTWLKSRLPDLGPIDSAFALTGSSETLKVSDARLQIGDSKQLAIDATGAVATLQVTPKLVVSGVDFKIRANAPTTAAVAQPLGFALPELGPVAASAKLSGDIQQLDLKQVLLRVGSGDHPMQLSGEIDNLLLRDNKAASAAVKGAVTPWLEGVLGRKLPELGQIHAAAQLADVSGNLRLRQIQVVADDTDLLSLKASSAESRVAGDGWGPLDIDLVAKDMTIFGDLFDVSIPALGPFSYNGRLVGEPATPRLSGTARLGKTEIKGDVMASFTGARPYISGELSSPVLYLADIGIRTDEPWQTGASPAPEKGRAILPFAALQALDFSLLIHLDQIEGVKMSIDRGTIDLALEDGRLRLHPLRFGFVGGSFAINASVNSRSDPAEIAVDVIGDNVLLQEVFAQYQKTVPLDGELDMQLNLTSRGNTMQALVSALDGSIDIAISRGQIYNRYFDLLGTNLIHWLMVGKETNAATDIRCLIGQFAVDSGDARIRALLLETSSTISKGSGDIDLANKTIDILVRPYSLRSRLTLTTPYRVKGLWRSPTVDYSKLRLAARAVEELGLAPIHTLDRLLPILSDRGKDPDNPCLDWAPTPSAVAASSISTFEPDAAGFSIDSMTPTPYVALTDSNVRKGPGTNYLLVETVAAGKTLEVTGKLQGLYWYRVTIASGEAGYVWGKLIRPSE
jgi:hypothetical protein